MRSLNNDSKSQYGNFLQFEFSLIRDLLIWRVVKLLDKSRLLRSSRIVQNFEPSDFPVFQAVLAGFN